MKTVEIYKDGEYIEDRVIDEDLYNAIYNQAVKDTEKLHLATYEWCDSCKEYDKEHHCCHRFTKTIKQTVDEVKNNLYDEGVVVGLRKSIEMIDEYKCNHSENRDAYPINYGTLLDFLRRLRKELSQYL